MDAAHRERSRIGASVSLGSLVAIALAVLLGSGAAATAFLAGHDRAQRESDQRRDERTRAAAREAADAQWLRRFDGVLALKLRRPHLEYVDERLVALGPVAERANPAVAPALDEWALLRRHRGDDAGARELETAARRLDHDPIRNRIRDLAAAGDTTALRSIATDPATVATTTTLLLARTLAALGAEDVAQRRLEHALERRPDDFGLQLALAETLSGCGPEAAAKARGHYAAAEVLDPGSVRAAVHHGWLLLDSADDAGAAVAQLGAAQRRMPDEPAIVYALGVALVKARHVPEGQQNLRRALELDPRFALAHAALGDSWTDEEDVERAQSEYRAALELADVEDARDGLGRLQLDTGQVAAARESLEEAVRLHPHDALLRDHYAAALTMDGRFADGLAELKRAVHEDGWLAEVENDYAWELVNSGDPSLRRPGQALPHAQRACALDPENAWYRNTLAVDLFRLGEWEKAAVEFELVCAMPRGGGAYDLFFLAMTKERLGAHADAIALFQRAIAVMDDEVSELRRLRDEASALIEGAAPRQRRKDGP
jgi:tetratricopeptide (TPR) repeat protein